MRFFSQLVFLKSFVPQQYNRFGSQILNTLVVLFFAAGSQLSNSAATKKPAATGAKAVKTSAMPVAKAAPQPSPTPKATPAVRAITHGDRETPMIALTFDDAPHPQYVPQLLALFRAENVKATFFLVGEQLKRFPDVARAIVADGHEIGNHSLSHKNAVRASAASVEEEIAGMQRLVKDLLGVTPAVYRPPFGNVSAEVKRICERENLAIVTWDVDTNDWRSGTTREMIVRNVLDNAASGSIVLFHATHLKTVEAVADLIPILRFRKLQMVTLSALLEAKSARAAKPRLAPYQQGPVALQLWEPQDNGRPPAAPAAPSTYSIQMPVLPLP